MGRIIKNACRYLSIGLILVIFVTQGCTFTSKAKPSAKEISQKSSAAGYLASLVEDTSGFIGGDRSAQAYIYDNAIALYALSEAGAVWHVEKLADAIVYAQDHDRTFSDGRLRNVYLTGDPSEDSGRALSSKSVPLPGFWQNGKWLEDYYSVSTSTGNMAWVVLALCKASEVAGKDKATDYITSARKGADFLLNFMSPSGGFTAGYEGWDDDQVKATYKSTEHNIALIAAFTAIAGKIEDTYPDKAREYREAADHAREFVLSMYDAEENCFYTGTEEDGETINVGVIPLDANALSYLVMGDSLTQPEAMIDFVRTHMSVGVGYDFSAGDLDGIWNEGTAQMAICYLKLGNTSEYDSVMGYLKTQQYKEGGIPAADRDGVSTGFLISGTDELWEYDNTLSICATGWYALAQLQKNPLEIS